MWVKTQERESENTRESRCMEYGAKYENCFIMSIFQQNLCSQKGLKEHRISSFIKLTIWIKKKLLVSFWVKSHKDLIVSDNAEDMIGNMEEAKDSLMNDKGMNHEAGTHYAWKPNWRLSKKDGESDTSGRDKKSLREEKTKKGVCWEFQRTGRCKYGASCKFEHVNNSGNRRETSGRIMLHWTEK